MYLYVLHSYSTQGPHFSSYSLILQDGANFVRNDCFVAGMRGVSKFSGKLFGSNQRVYFSMEMLTVTIPDNLVFAHILEVGRIYSCSSWFYECV